MCWVSRFYPSWWENPPVFLLLIPAVDGFIEALVFALKPDDQFDKRYNPDSGRTTRTGWNAVLADIFTTLFGGIVVTRSEERRFGKVCVSTFRSRGSSYD